MNFKTIIIAGLGTIGSSLLKLGQDVLDNFESVVAVDKRPEKLIQLPEIDISCRSGDIEDLLFLNSLFLDVKFPALFVNLCSGVDSVRIRKAVSFYDVAYIDTCASGIYQRVEYRFSKLMPYTRTKVNSPFPHLLCWGINPGLVEIISRKIIKDFRGRDRLFDVSIFEYDQLDADLDNSKAAVGWSPEALVEEVMISPSFQIADGRHLESDNKGADEIVSYWEGKKVLSRLVGHEDVWNIGELGFVKSAKFIYALSPKVMNVFNGDPGSAADKLMVPDEGVRVFGTERVAVRVKGIETGMENTLLWKVDHEKVWRQHKVNAVQYQTGKSLLLAVMLLQGTHFGRLPLNCCAADLPLDERDWVNIEKMMDDLDIHWSEANHLRLHTKPWS